MAYRFKLETLYTFRKNIEEQSRLRLAREIAILEGLRKRLAELRAERLRLIDELEVNKKKPLAVFQYQFFMDAISFAEMEIVKQTGRIAAQEEAVVYVRQELVVKMQDRKVIEKVRERDKKAYINELAKQEQKEGDEQVLLRFGKEKGL
jgi:flagellar FliJ protein